MNRAIPIEKAEYYPKSPKYKLLPSNFARSKRFGDDILLTSLTGEFKFVRDHTFQEYVNKQLARESNDYKDLLGRHMLYEEELHNPQEEMAAQIRTKKVFISKGPTLHIFVVTLRCDHSCQYCQVSRQSCDVSSFDMSLENAMSAVDRVFESTAKELTIEFQGGEPLLAFPIIRAIVEAIDNRNSVEKRKINYVITSTLHYLTPEILELCEHYQITFSTSLDGPAFIHNKNRPITGKNSHEKTVDGIAMVRDRLGKDSVSALTTITRLSLSNPREIVDEYVKRGFHSIFLRPLSPYGFASKTNHRIGYDMGEFLNFYESALAYIIELNKSGIHIEESYTAVILRHILTPFATGYVDLRSPAGAGLGALVYNYDGYVYPSDEARMLVEMGDTDLRLGNVTDGYQTLYSSSAMQALLEGSLNEFIPGCESCAYQPYCGADPVANYASNGDPIGFRPNSNFCKRHMGIFEIIFQYLHEKDPEIMNIFLKWLRRRGLEVHASRPIV